MSIPRDHHFIPAFYLRQWCDARRKLIEYSRKYDQLIPKPVGPNATGYEFDLYAFHDLPADLSQFLEQRFFDYADRTAADALQIHLTGRDKWTPELASAWSRFVIGLHLRHPDAMPEYRVAAQSIWEGSGKVAQEQYELIRQPNDPATFDEYIANRDPHTPAKARLNIIIKGVFDNEVVCQRVMKMKWGVADVSASPHKLLTSDRPVGLFNIGDKKGLITLPISPTKLFVAVNDEKVIGALRGVQLRKIVRENNIQVVTRARRFVWAADRSQESFIQKYMSTKLEPTPLFPSLGHWPI